MSLQLAFSRISFPINSIIQIRSLSTSLDLIVGTASSLPWSVSAPSPASSCCFCLFGELFRSPSLKLACNSHSIQFTLTTLRFAGFRGAVTRWHDHHYYLIPGGSPRPRNKAHAHHRHPSLLLAPAPRHHQAYSLSLCLSLFWKLPIWEITHRSSSLASTL